MAFVPGRPYPHAAFPASEPRDWEQQRHNRSNSWTTTSAVDIRSDPSLLPIGAIEKKPSFPEAPPANRQKDAEPEDKEKKKKMEKKIDAFTQEGPWSMLLGELEDSLPRRCQPFFELLRGRYQVVASPSAPSSSFINLPS